MVLKGKEPTLKFFVQPISVFLRNVSCTLIDLKLLFTKLTYKITDYENFYVHYLKAPFKFH